MFGVLLNGKPMGLQEQNGEFNYLVFNTQEESQNFCNNIAKSLGYAVEVIPCKIQTREEYDEEQYGKIPGISEVNTYSRLNTYDGEGEQ